MKIIAGAEFLKFDNLTPEDLEGGEEEPTVLMGQITDVDISDLIDLRQNTVNLDMSGRKGGAAFMPPGISLQGGSNLMDLDAELGLGNTSKQTPKRSP